MQLRPRAIALLLAVPALVACAPPKSPVMAPSLTGRLLGPAPGLVTILFLADVRDALGSSHVWTVFDERRRFHGELTGVSGFETRVPAGRHTFGASPVRAGWNGSLCFAGDYEAGKYYVVWLRMSNDAGFWNTKWLALRPDSKILDAKEIIAKTPIFDPDVRAGQAFLDGKSPAACGSDIEVNPASFGFESAPSRP